MQGLAALVALKASGRRSFNTFICARCEKEKPWDEGADDDHPDLCDDCWCEVESGKDPEERKEVT